MLCFSLVSFSIALAMSLLFIKTGLIFVGMFIAIIACIVANVTVLDLIYNFIVNRKSKLGVIGISFFLSLVLFGFGVGLFAIGFKNFEMVEEYNEKYMNKTEETINMENGLFIETSMGELEYIESDNKDIKLVYETSKTYEINKLKDGNKLYINNNYHDGFKTLRYVLDNANDKVFVNPDYLKVTVYTNKDNIEKLKSNKENYYKNLRDNEKNSEISRLEEENRKLRAEISELRNEE